MKYKTCFLLALVLNLFLSACATFQKNTPLSRYNETEGYRFDNLNRGINNTDSLFIILAFSGGGTRAASFSYGVMEALRDQEIIWKGQTKRLIEEIDIISSVSGGSFTAAYYGLHGDGLFDGNFEQNFLKKNIEGELIFELFSPFNWYKLAGYGYSRSDLAADYYNEKIFKGATYADLIKKNSKPFVIINATDMSTGEQFPFIQDQLDLICSDLGSLHIARAVASSSAFPGLLTPLTYVNYAGNCHYKEPQWVELAIGDWRISPERANIAEKRRSYYQTPPFKRKREFIHLIDGGVSDNIGIRGIIY
jgi:predicted acylesterase/phospholipase RssA